tara:strand:+ start:1328 stop:1828 length:501 start_codon:yes stop_codon:yes gene_type:complete
MKFADYISDDAVTRALNRSELRVHRRRRPGRRGILALSLSIGVVVAGTAAAVSITQASLERQLGEATCFSEWSTSSASFRTFHSDEIAVVGDRGSQPMPTAANATPSAEQAALEGCQAGWETGYFGPTSPPASLFACVLRDRTLGVFPHTAIEEDCEDLGLAEPQG